MVILAFITDLTLGFLIEILLTRECRCGNVIQINILIVMVYIDV